jgi:hypothetical protein
MYYVKSYDARLPIKYSRIYQKYRLPSWKGEGWVFYYGVGDFYNGRVL